MTNTGGGVMNIDSFSFGEVVVSGKKYNNDLIVFPDGVKENWTREAGHYLQVEDLQDVFESDVDYLVVGKGVESIMKVSPEVYSKLRGYNIKIIEENTEEAVKTYNKMASAGEKVAAALHLTC